MSTCSLLSTAMPPKKGGSAAPGREPYLFVGEIGYGLLIVLLTLAKITWDGLR